MEANKVVVVSGKKVYYFTQNDDYDDYCDDDNDDDDHGEFINKETRKFCISKQEIGLTRFKFELVKLNSTFGSEINKLKQQQQLLV